MPESEGPNAAQIEYWNEVSGPKWVRLSDDIDAQIAPLGREVMDRAGLRPGLRILDVGCGCGLTSIELALRVGESGAVVGLDISGPMLASARTRAAERGIQNIEFVQADAQTHDFGADLYDRIFSRFGVMFFADPIAAFANLRRALAPDGTLHFACWQGIDKNPWMQVPVAAIARHIEIPLPVDPNAPGPFSFADADRLRGILEDAGFEDIRIDALDRDADLGGGKSLDDTVDFIVQMGPAGAAYREASPEVQRAAARAVRDAVAPYQSDSGIVMSAGIWAVSARPGA